MRENRIALAIGKINQLEETGATHADVPLMVTVHSHPECRFRWSRLIVDLSPTPGARIRDISRREVRGDKPVEIKTSVGIGFKIETAAKALSAEVSPKVEQSRTVYYPDIVSSGLGTKKALWDFQFPELGSLLLGDALPIQVLGGLAMRSPQQQLALLPVQLRRQPALPYPFAALVAGNRRRLALNRRRKATAECLHREFQLSF
jgi:hypothetical protein